MGSDWLMADHAPPGTPLDEADAEMVVVDLFADGDVVLLEFEGHRLVFKGDELRDRIAPARGVKAA